MHGISSVMLFFASGILSEMKKYSDEKPVQTYDSWLISDEKPIKIFDSLWISDEKTGRNFQWSWFLNRRKTIFELFFEISRRKTWSRKNRWNTMHSEQSSNEKLFCPSWVPTKYNVLFMVFSLDRPLFSFIRFQLRSSIHLEETARQGTRFWVRAFKNLCALITMPL